MEKNLQASQFLLSIHAMKSPILLVLKVELVRFWKVLGLNKMPLNNKNSFFFFFRLCVNDHCMCNFDHSFLLHFKSTHLISFSICHKKFRIIEICQINKKTPKTPKFECCLYFIKLQFQQWGFFVFTQITHFYYQNIQIEIPYNSTKLKKINYEKIQAIGTLYGCKSRLSFGTSLVKHQLRVKLPTFYLISLINVMFSSDNNNLFDLLSHSLNMKLLSVLPLISFH